ncbi:S2P endopeptidase [Malassezia caprae]|uniref:Endopeptidase S2P n=1 Tax=Malassezia caprae TaxID=1381934 RepID=A0AAF0E3R7_9BASI|nr:S2P endopeptidase [Malassezia caprae]
MLVRLAPSVYLGRTPSPGTSVLMWSALVGVVVWALLLQTVARYRLGSPNLSLLYAPVSLGSLRTRIPLGALRFETSHVPPWLAGMLRAHTGSYAGRRWFDLGIVVASVSILGALVVLCVTCAQVVSRLWLVHAPTSHLGKRAVDEPTSPLWITPLIWNVNLTSSELVPLLLVMAASQLVHEAGHVLAAFLHKVRPLRWGLTLVFPCVVVAHVTFPDMSHLSARKQLRVVAAGVWHNAVTLVAWAAIAALASGLWVDAGGWRVTSCSDASLAAYFHRDTTLTAVNDLSLAAMPPQERTTWWHRMLEDALPRELGWCIPASNWTRADAACCAASEDARGCFVDERHTSKCFDVLSVFEQVARCDETCNGACAHVDPFHPLVRLRLQQPDGSTDHVVLQGRSSSLGTRVRVSSYRLWAPLRVLGGHGMVDALGDSLRHLSRYVYMIQVSMVLFNMLPIDGLDGGHMVELGLRMLWPDTAMPLYTPGTSAPYTPSLRLSPSALYAWLDRVTKGLGVVALLGSTWLTLVSRPTGAV